MYERQDVASPPIMVHNMAFNTPDPLLVDTRRNGCTGAFKTGRCSPPISVSATVCPSSIPPPVRWFIFIFTYTDEEEGSPPSPYVIYSHREKA